MTYQNESGSTKTQVNNPGTPNAATHWSCVNVSYWYDTLAWIQLTPEIFLLDINNINLN